MSVPVADAQSTTEIGARRDDRRYEGTIGGMIAAVTGGRIFLIVIQERSARPGSAKLDRRDLEGTWYLNGDRDKRTEIIASRDGFEARNEKGSTSRLEVSRNGDVYAREWERGLRGNIRRDRIEWENGTTWTREPSSREARR